MQKPLPSGFGAMTTADEVIARGERRLDGWNVIVTGGYAGIGLETTRVLAAAGAHVIVPARTKEKARAALEGMAGVELAETDLDLAAPASVDAFAEAFLRSKRPLHRLINNAGIMAAPLTRDARGYESQFATNHLGHFQLTARLWPALLATAASGGGGGGGEGGARVVNLTSRGHHRAPVDFEDPNFDRRPYDKWAAYGQSKTANVLFTIELDRRGRERGVRSFAVHPGAILTDLVRHMSKEETDRVIDNVKRTGVVKTVAQGASTTVWCATSKQLDNHGGVYCEDTDIAAPAVADSSNGVRSWAIDPAAATKLWELSERLTGVVYPS